MSPRRRGAFVAAGVVAVAAIAVGTTGLLRHADAPPNAHPQLGSALVDAPIDAPAGTARTVASAGTARTVNPATPANAHPPAGRFRPDERKVAACGASWSCLEQAFGNLAYYNGPAVALRRFDTAIARDPAVESDCHRIVHTIGSATLARYRGDVSRAFAVGSASCGSGYYHGILEHALGGQMTKQNLVRVARRICAGSLVRRSQYLTYQCVHGLGHGLMLQGGYDLPFALSVCDRLRTEWDQQSCSGGVFMENINGANGTPYGFKTPWLRDDDLIYPCDTVARRHKLYCYLMVTSRIIKANGDDWQATARLCAKVERAWVTTCFESYGRDVSGFTRMRPSRILSLCAIAGRFGHAGACLYGAARDMTNNYANGRRAAAFCTRAPIPFRERCFYAIGTILQTIVVRPAERRAACTRLSRPHAGACFRGASAG